MSISVERLGRTFFARVTGVDLTKPVSDRDLADIRQAIRDHAVLMFPGQPFTDETQEAFARNFGELEPGLYDPSQFTAPLGNLDEEGELLDPDSDKSKFLRANELWHSDSTYFPAPARLSFLSGRIVSPERGETQWADFRAAYRDMPPARQAELEDLIVIHDIQNSRRKMGRDLTPEERAKWPPVQHPLIRIHEDTGDRALYVGSQATQVVGKNEEESQVLFKELLDHATQDQFVYTHSWTPNEFVIWDNRRVVHRRRPWDETKYPRVMYRCTVWCEGPTVIDGKRVDEHARLNARMAAA